MSLTPLRVDVELGGKLAGGATLMRAPDGDAAPNASVALDVRAGEFEEFFVERLAAGVRAPV